MEPQARVPDPPLLEVYRRLLEAFGPQRWWPGETPFEVIVGAILTQSAAWTNVEKAIANLKAAGVLAPAALRRTPRDELARLIYPSGYYNAKAAKLHSFVDHLARYDDDLDRLFAGEISSLRRELLAIHGIGEETADSIILYAAGKPTFVIDAYTRRILERLGVPSGREGYGAVQALFHAALPADAPLFNEYHALLVLLGKETCRKRAPRCGACPVLPICETGRRNMEQGSRNRDAGSGAPDPASRA